VSSFLRDFVFTVGWVVGLSLYLLMGFLTFYQWFIPDHVLHLCFSSRNESLFECLFVVVTFPFVAHFFLGVRRWEN